MEMGSGAGAWYRVGGGAKNKEFRIFYVIARYRTFLCLDNGSGVKKIGKVKG